MDAQESGDPEGEKARMEGEDPGEDRCAGGEPAGEDGPERARQLAAGHEVSQRLVSLLVPAQDGPRDHHQEHQSGHPDAGVPGQFPGRPVRATVEDPGDVGHDRDDHGRGGPVMEVAGEVTERGPADDVEHAVVCARRIRVVELGQPGTRDDEDDEADEGEGAQGVAERPGDVRDRVLELAQAETVGPGASGLAGPLEVVGRLLPTGGSGIRGGHRPCRLGRK